MVMSTEEQESTMRLIEAYKRHNPLTGFREWKENTPEYVKQAEKELHWFKKWNKVFGKASKGFFG